MKRLNLKENWSITVDEDHPDPANPSAMRVRLTSGVHYVHVEATQYRFFGENGANLLEVVFPGVWNWTETNSIACDNWVFHGPIVDGSVMEGEPFVTTVVLRIDHCERDV